MAITDFESGRGADHPGGFIAQRPFLWVACIGVAYFLAHQIAFLFPDAETALMAVWPAGGIGLAALLLSPRRLWPVIAAVLFLAGYAADFLAGRPFTGSMGFMTANIAESLGCAWLIRSFCGEEITFGRVREVVALLCGAVFVNAATSLIGVGTAWFIGTATLSQFWKTWCTADGLGILLITPLVVSWAGKREAAAEGGRDRRAEACAFFFLWCLVAWRSFNPGFGLSLHTPPAYLLVALLPWPALRLGLRGTTLALVSLTAVVLTSKAVTVGPLIWGGKDLTDRLVLAQLFAAVLSVFGLLLAASYTESRAAARSARESEKKYRELVEWANSIILRWDASGVITFCNEFGLRFFGYSRDELIGRNAVGTIVPQTDSAGNNLAQMVSDIHAQPEKYVNNRNENIRKDGTRVWVAWTNRPILDDQGRCVEMLAVGNDITDRKGAEDALRESEARYRRLLDEAPYPLVVTDHGRGTILYINQPGADLFEVDKQQSLGKETDAFYGEVGLRDRMMTLLRREGTIKDQELMMRTAKGRCFHAQISVNIAQYERGSAALISVIDITERKRAEEALQFSQFALEHMADAAFFVTENGHVEYANEAACHLLGYTKLELSGMAVSDVAEDYTVEKWRTHWDALKRAGSLCFESRHMTKDGRVVPVEILANYMSFGGREYNCGFVRDISDRKRAEEEYRTLFREMLDGFALHEIICDEKGVPADYRYLAVNPAFERMTGLKAEDILGRTVLELLPGTERHWIETYGKVALTGEPAFFENYAAVLKKHFEVTAFRPRPNQFACIFGDITDRKRAGEEKARLEAQLQHAQKLESVGRLAGGVAHDFNNMLGVILGFTDMALLQVDPAQPLHDDLDEIRKAAERSADLTGQLLAFARRQTVAPQVLDLNDLVLGLLKMMQRLIGENISLSWEPGANLWKIRIDPSQVDQMLANLCVNSRDAVTDLGRIAIRTENCTVKARCGAEHDDLAPGEYVLLTVSDNGCGMDKETLERVFEPFFTTKELGKGTGLGLATIYGVVKQNNGFIEVQSEVGKGTTFSIYLPRHADPAGHTAVDAVPCPNMGGQETILLVEDEPAFLKLTGTMLQRQGYSVLTADTPGEALRMARERQGEISLLITDVVMPEMNGRDLAKNLLSLYPGMKRLFMSGYTADVIAHQGVLAEGIHFIQKPFSASKLVAKVREILDSE